MNEPSSPFRSRAFQLFWLGEAISGLGDQFYLVALPLLTFELTNSTAALGGVLMAAAIPRALFMPLGGIMVDRLSPQRILLLSNAVRGAAVSVICGLLAWSSAAVWQLFVLAIIFGIADAFSFPAFMSLPPRLVDERRLARANGAIQGTAHLMGVLGPALAGVVIAAVGLRLAFVIDAASFAVSILTLWGMIRLTPAAKSSAGRSEPAAAELSGASSADASTAALSAPSASAAAESARARPAERVPVASDGATGASLFKEAARYTFGDPVLRTVLTIVAAINVGVLGPIGVGLPALAVKQLNGGSTLLGVLLASFGAGTLLGTLIAAYAPRPERAGRITSWSTLTLALGMACVGVASAMPGAVPFIFVTLVLAGTALGYLNIIGISWLQARVPAVMMGRVMAFMVLAANGLVPFSYALSGFVAEMGVTPLFVGGGAAVACAWLAARAPAFRAATWGLQPLQSFAKPAVGIAQDGITAAPELRSEG